MCYTPINDLLYFPHFSWVWNLTSSIISGPCVTTSFPPHPVSPPPFTQAPWCLKYGCCFYIKCCYQSTTWITMNNVSWICHLGGKDRAKLIIGVAARLVWYKRQRLRADACLKRTFLDVGSKQKGEEKNIQNPHVCALCLFAAVHTFSILGACCSGVVHKRRCVTGAFALMCHQSAELQTVPTWPGSLNSPTHRQGRDNSLRHCKCGASIKLSITQLVFREVWSQKGR